VARRHVLRPGDWESVALRLDEIISAHTGEDPFDEAFKLLLACLAYEVDPSGAEPFLTRHPGESAIAEVNRLLRLAVERWPGILAPSATTHLSAPELLRCATVLAGVRLLDKDLVGLDAIFEFIVNQAAKGQKGQFFTPRHVIAAIVDMVRPQAGECVADPACGSGGFLHHALRYQPRCSVWGFDQDSRASRVARVMLAASGEDASRITRLDSLRRPSSDASPDTYSCIEHRMLCHDSQFKGFDLIITNPPFAGDVGEEYSKSYQLAQSRHAERDVLFIERCVDLLKPQGRLAMVLPYNKLGGQHWGYMRKWLMARMSLVAVLALGRHTFQPHTSQKACVLIGIKRTMPVSRFDDDEILFFISDREGKDARGRLLLGPDGCSVAHDLPEATPLVQARFDRLQALV